MQLIALWEKSTNWRVLQASAHAGGLNSFSYETSGLTPLYQVGTKPNNVFDYNSEIAQYDFEEDKQPGSTGAVLESMRSFSAEMGMKTSLEVDWKPVILAECFELSIPCSFRHDYDDEEIIT